MLEGQLFSVIFLYVPTNRKWFVGNNFIAMTFHLLAVFLLILKLCKSGMIEFDSLFNVKVETTILTFSNCFPLAIWCGI